MLRGGSRRLVRALHITSHRGSSLKGASVTKSTTALQRPQYDFKALRTSPDELQQSVEKRKIKLPGDATVNDITSSYQRLLEARSQRDQLITHRSALQKHLQQKPTGDELTSLRSALGDIKVEMKALERTIDDMEVAVLPLVEAMPNWISPDSTELEEPLLLETIHPEKKAAADPLLSHRDLGIKLNLIDFESASRVSGYSSYYLINDGALLEQALIQYALSRCRALGWQMMTPPSLVRSEFTTACGFKPRDQNNEQQIYMINDGSSEPSLCLTGTAEIPLAGWAAHKQLVLSEDKPVLKVGVSRSYRAEAGARGADTKGLYRVHEFTKVELFAWTTTKEAAEHLHDQILNLQKSILEELGLCCRVLNMPPDDLGAPAYKKYDIEAWMPGRGDWGEVTSASNCLDYQSRRLHTRYLASDGTAKFAMTLNGTAMAVPRVIIALLENNYDPATNRVHIPKVLRKWMDDREWIERC